MGRYDKKYLRCDTTSVRDTKVGGKEYSVVLNEELANGVLVTLGKGFVPSAIAKNTMIKQASLPTASTSRLFLVFDPEINYKDDYQSDRQLGIHRIEANKPVAAVQLRNFDQITYSADYFKKDEKFYIPTPQCFFKMRVKCYSSCSSCDEIGNEANHKCTDCIRNYHPVEFTNNCYTSQIDGYYYDSLVEIYKKCIQNAHYLMIFAR